VIPLKVMDSHAHTSMDSIDEKVITFLMGSQILIFSEIYLIVIKTKH